MRISCTILTLNKITIYTLQRHSRLYIIIYRMTVKNTNTKINLVKGDIINTFVVNIFVTWTI